MKRLIKNKINKINAELRLIKEAIFNYNYDIWGYTAQDNLKQIEKLRVERQRLLLHKLFWKMFI